MIRRTKKNKKNLYSEFILEYNSYREIHRITGYG
jgi:hypothetical protein